MKPPSISPLFNQPDMLVVNQRVTDLEQSIELLETKMERNSKAMKELMDAFDKLTDKQPHVGEITQRMDSVESKIDALMDMIGTIFGQMRVQEELNGQNPNQMASNGKETDQLVPGVQTKLPIKNLHVKVSKKVQEKALEITQLNDRRFDFGWHELETLQLASRGSGLVNGHSICFMNSVLQFVFHTPQLMRYIALAKKNHICANKIYCAYCVLYNYYITICERHPTFTAVELHGIVDSYFPNRIPNRSEDAHEMLIFLLNKLEQSDVTPTTVVDQIFGGKTKTQIKCGTCRYEGNIIEEFRDLSLALPRPTSQNQPIHLEAIIKSYFMSESLDDYKCDKCGEKKSIRSPRIEVAPNILIIHLKRFNGYSNKNHSRVTAPFTLDLSKHASKEDQNLKYQLYGFISHVGSTVRNGHYTATMLGYDGKGYRFDDTEVDEAILGRFNQRQPYLLFYYKVPSS